jgi:hypothetical protein
MKSKKEVYGSMTFSYFTLAMPLDVAHKVQALLAEHAVMVESIYCKHNGPPVYCIRPWGMSAVSVVKAPDYDCEGMDEEDFREWSGAVRERPEGAPIMDPNEFALLRKE